MTLETPRRKGFVTTEWAVVQDAAQAEQRLRSAALARLVRHYQPALEEYLSLRFSLSHEERQDLLQGFYMEKVMQKNLLAQADRQRGKFRTFLLQAINSHVLDHFKREKARKRHPEGGFASLELLIANGAEFRDAAAPAFGSDVFDSVFAKQVIAEAIQQTHGYCMERNLRDVWEILHARVLGPLLEDAPPIPYPELVDELGLEGPQAAQNKLASAKRILQRQLKQRIQHFTAGDHELSDEIDYLRSFLKKNSGKKSHPSP